MSASEIDVNRQLEQVLSYRPAYRVSIPVASFIRSVTTLIYSATPHCQRPVSVQREGKLFQEKQPGVHRQFLARDSI